MEIRIFEPDDSDFEDFEFDDYYRLEVNKKDVITLMEKNHIAFSDVRKIPELLKMAYEAGKKGEELTILQK